MNQLQFYWANAAAVTRQTFFFCCFLSFFFLVSAKALTWSVANWNHVLMMRFSRVSWYNLVVFTEMKISLRLIVVGFGVAVTLYSYKRRFSCNSLIRCRSFGLFTFFPRNHSVLKSNGNCWSSMMAFTADASFTNNGYDCVHKKWKKQNKPKMKLKLTIGMNIHYPKSNHH